MDHAKKIFFLIVALGLFIISTAAAQITSFKDKKPTCDRYVLNTYIYLTISLSLLISLVMIFNMIMPGYIMYVSGFMLFLMLIHLLISFLFIYLIHSIPATDVIKKRFVWGLFIINFALILLPFIQAIILSGNEDIIMSSIFITFAIVAFLTLLIYVSPDLIIKNTQSWTPYILIALVGLILAYLIPMIFCAFGKCNLMTLNRWYYYLAVIGIILFIFIILYKTKIVVENSEKCKSPEDADYIKESTGLFISIINLFIDIVSARSRRRL